PTSPALGQSAPARSLLCDLRGRCRKRLRLQKTLLQNTLLQKTLLQKTLLQKTQCVLQRRGCMLPTPDGLNWAAVSITRRNALASNGFSTIMLDSRLTLSLNSWLNNPPVAKTKRAASASFSSRT